MTKISVDKDELKTIRDKIDNLLEKGKQSLAAYTQEPLYESYDLSDKEQLIIEYLNKNPGNTKEQVTTGLSRHYSRMTIRNTIDALVERGLIIKSQDKLRKRSYHLYVNYQNITTSFKNDLGLFKMVYFYLLDDTIPVINKLLLEQNDKDKARDLLNALIGPYKYLCIMCVTSDIFLWQRRPLDDDTLHRKFEVFFKTAKQIHSKLLKIWPDSEAGSAASHILYSSQFGFLDVHIRSMLETFEEYGLSRYAEPVLDLLWKISYPILPLIYPTCYNKDLKDWRIVLENMPEYKPKTEQITYDGNV
jgi:predicted transcriptional regulator